MQAIDKYLSKLPNALITELPHQDLGIVVCIPAFNESLLINSLNALLQADKPSAAVEILVNINYSEQTNAEEKLFNQKAYRILQHFAQKNSSDKFKIIPILTADIPKKIAGVGYARKIIMDEAFRRLLKVGNEKGLILGFDADSTCKKNYFTEIEKSFQQDAQLSGVSIFFEHEIEGSNYPQEIYDAIILYELHLRYYVNALRIIKTPYAYQTVGSSFAVRANTYAAVGGMAPKKAGEDFYFLQKVMTNNKFTNLNSTKVYPSPRISTRVGFGTGPSVKEISNIGYKNSFNFASFLAIKKIFDWIPFIFSSKKSLKDWDIHPILKKYLLDKNANKELDRILRNHKTEKAFRKAFYQWLNGFQILKMLNQLKADNEFKEQDILSCVREMRAYQNKKKDNLSAKDYLKTMRKEDCLLF